MQRPKRSAKMRMSMRQPATGSGCRNEIAASAQLDAWAPACIRIGWISSSRLTRECITDVVSRTHPSFEVTTFNSSSACLSLLPKPLDLIVYHLRGQGVADLQELAELRKAPAGVKLVVLSDSASIARSLIQRSLAEGTAGFILTTSSSLDLILSAIRLVSSGGSFVSREFFLTDRPSKRPPVGPDAQEVPQITRRERSVLELIKRGKPNKIIARELGLSVCTVKIHARNLIRKMGAANRTEAAVNADNFLLHPPEQESIQNHERSNSRWTDAVSGHHKWHCVSD
jgi:DNA-binding NarL/FixJ family response regulator